MRESSVLAKIDSVIFLVVIIIVVAETSFGYQ